MKPMIHFGTTVFTNESLVTNMSIN